MAGLDELVGDVSVSSGRGGLDELVGNAEPKKKTSKAVPALSELKRKEIADWVRNNKFGTKDEFLKDVKSFTAWNPESASRAYDEISRGKWADYGNLEGKTRLGRAALKRNSGVTRKDIAVSSLLNTNLTGKELLRKTEKPVQIQPSSQSAAARIQRAQTHAANMAQTNPDKARSYLANIYSSLNEKDKAYMQDYLSGSQNLSESSSRDILMSGLLMGAPAGLLGKGAKSLFNIRPDAKVAAALGRAGVSHKIAKAAGVASRVPAGAAEGIAFNAAATSPDLLFDPKKFLNENAQGAKTAASLGALFRLTG